MMLPWKRGINTPESLYPLPPLFGDPCHANSPGAWRNLGGWWVRERFVCHVGKDKGKNLSDIKG